MLEVVAVFAAELEELLPPEIVVVLADPEPVAVDPALPMKPPVFVVFL